jgi:hypothetical protein
MSIHPLCESQTSQSEIQRLGSRFERASTADTDCDQHAPLLFILERLNSSKFVGEFSCNALH